MAHAGKTYKVAFRRDLHLDVPNFAGWPAGWRAFVSGVGNPHGTWPSGTEFVCGEDFTHGSLPMEWVSKPTSVLGVDWELTIRIASPSFHLVGRTLVDFVLFDLSFGLVFSLTYNCQFATYGAFGTELLTPTGTIVPPYSWNPPFSGIDCSAAPWSVYP